MKTSLLLLFFILSCPPLCAVELIELPRKVSPEEFKAIYLKAIHPVFVHYRTKTMPKMLREKKELERYLSIASQKMVRTKHPQNKEKYQQFIENFQRQIEILEVRHKMYLLFEKCSIAIAEKNQSQVLACEKLYHQLGEKYISLFKDPAKAKNISFITEYENETQKVLLLPKEKF